MRRRGEHSALRPLIAMHKRVGYGLIPYRFLGATEVFVLSFAVAILLGALALMLPSSTVSGDIRFIDALFTSTSAVCVTGLTVLDTATYFTRSGQFIIMCLIQLGGLGIMTFSIVLLILSGRRLSLRDKMILQDAFVPAPIVEVPSLVRRLFLSTLAIEGLGALALYLFTPGQDSLRSRLPFGVGLLQCGLCAQVHELHGIPVQRGCQSDHMLPDCARRARFFHAYRPGQEARPTVKRCRISAHSRLVLTVTAALILVGAFGFYVFEAGNVLAGDDFSGVFLASLFQSVTARTAGFNTVEFGHLARPARHRAQPAGDPGRQGHGHTLGAHQPAQDRARGATGRDPRSGLVSTLHFDDIRAAAERLRGQVIDTPCLPSRTLSAHAPAARSFSSSRTTSSPRPSRSVVRSTRWRS